jgi:hypothetical protein
MLVKTLVFNAKRLLKQALQCIIYREVSAKADAQRVRGARLDAIYRKEPAKAGAQTARGRKARRYLSQGAC